MKEWTNVMTTRDGTEARYLGECGVTGKRRVLIQHPAAYRPDFPTVYLYDENGSCNCGGKESHLDLVAT